MTHRDSKVLCGQVIENETRITLRQLCRLCSVRAEYILDMIDEGFIEPAGKQNAHWCFHTSSIRRVRKAHRLQQDLGLNLAGAALAVDLMEEIERLRTRLQRR